MRVREYARTCVSVLRACVCSLEGLVKANNRPKAVTRHPLDWILPPLPAAHHGGSERIRTFSDRQELETTYTGYFTDMFWSIYFYYTTRIAGDRLGKSACTRELGQFAGRLIHCTSKISVYCAAP